MDLEQLGITGTSLSKLSSIMDYILLMFYISSACMPSELF